jgi:mannonate dehydratase
VVMRIAVGQAARATHEYLAFARQIGAAGVQFNTPDLPGERRWEVDDLLALRERVESYGLRLEAIENLPNSFYTAAMFGLPGRDEEIDRSGTWAGPASPSWASTGCRRRSGGRRSRPKAGAAP